MNDKEWSESKTTKIAQKMSAIMTDVRYVQKDGTNKFQNYKYVSEANIVDKISQSMITHKVIALPEIISCNVSDIGETKAGVMQRMTSIMARYTFMDAESGESLAVILSGQGVDTSDKGVYKAMTGLNKYVLMKTFQIPAGDDPEADEPNPNPKKSKPKSKSKVKPSEPTMTGNNMLSKLQDRVKNNLVMFVNSNIMTSDERDNFIKVHLGTKTIGGCVDRGQLEIALVDIKAIYKNRDKTKATS